ncbi:MAG: HIT domain-containing protein [Planctomycetes bacterium]|nr:HIT domain-containing protein [Planctomycetota bacterium]
MGDGNANLWAPWRMEYIRTLAEEHKDDGCFLCRYWQQPDRDRESRVITRSESCYVVMNRFPYSNGHLLIACGRHCGRFDELTDDEHRQMTSLTRKMILALEETVHAQGFNVGTNLGRCAGAGLPDHLHTHIVPRWSGDTNYMSVVGDVRVINDSLDALYEQLRGQVGD